jgi:acyl dehydratase
MALAKLEVDQQIPSVSKRVTQDSINQFESCGILDRENIHNSPELAQKRLGTNYAIASGRMSVAFAAESLRRFFGPEVFNHTGTINLKFLRPVKNGDTITVHGAVRHWEKAEKGTLVAVDIYCENQDSDKTAVGVGTAVLP